MRNAIVGLAVAVGVGVLACGASGQEAGGPAAKAPAESPVVTRMMASDKNHDGKLTRDEVTDPRLQRLFERADADKDGVVTREELTAVAGKMEAEGPAGGRGRGGPGGRPDGFAGPGGGRGPGGGGRPQPGQVMPRPVQEMLNLTAEQKEKVAALQKEVDEKLATILTEEQLKQVKEMRDRGPRGRGPGGPPQAGVERGRPEGL